MRVRLSIFACLLLFLLACRAEREPEVWFVHATDPHLFEEPGRRIPDETLNERAFQAFLQSMHSVPGVGVRPDFLVITGDFGIAEREKAETPQEKTAREAREAARCAATAAPVAGTAAPTGSPAAAQPAAGAQPPSQPTAGPQASAQPGAGAQPAARASTAGAASPAASSGGLSATAREGRIARLAALLEASPVRDVYFVPGNNDVTDENADEASLREAASFFDEVEKRLGGKVALHDLTRCYLKGTPLAGCYADVPGTSFRLIGFPSSSFKCPRPEQQGQLDRFAALLTQAAAHDRRVLVVTHVPEMDDPYKVARSLQGRATRVAAGQPPLSAWNVPAGLSKRWKDLIGSGDVAGVLAGHFHDSHRGIYQSPYRWASRSQDRADPAKNLLAPPLAIRLQADSPVQARGFSLIGLGDDEIRDRRLVWYDPVRNTFQPQQAAPEPEPEHDDGWRIGFSDGARWLWSIGPEKANLARAVVIALALLLAFLTVVALWETPPPDQRLANPTPGGQNPPGTATTTTATTTAASTTTTTTSAAGRTNLFPSNIGKTVLAGLTGFLAVDFLMKTFWEGSGIDANAYFLLFFVIFFLVILITFSILQGLAEGLRSRVMLQQPSAPWTPLPEAREGESSRGRSRLVHFLAYWLRRIWSWVLSLPSFLLVFFDTAFSLLRGSNQTQSAAFEKTITDLHWSLVATADRVRDAIKGALLQAVGRQAEPESVRVGISMLSDDETYLYYISSERGSLYQTFPKRSLAWVAVYAGVARWWHKEFTTNQQYESKPIILFENQKEVLQGLEEDLRLTDYYQARGAQDYQAFVVLPVPWARRGSDYFRKAAVHISFREAGDLEKIWPGLLHLQEETRSTSTASRTVYTYPDNWIQMLRSKTEKVGDARHESAETAAPGQPPAPAGQGQNPSPQIYLQDRQLGAVLLESVGVLTELLRFFNQRVFEERIKPQRRP
jgi:3',5'-cyclic AMP phosphodiesterase CpdA